MIGIPLLNDAIKLCLRVTGQGIFIDKAAGISGRKETVMKFRRMMERAAEKKEEIRDREEMERNEQYVREMEAVRRLAGEMAECYAVIAETDLSEESDDAVREMIYRMFQRGEYYEALNLLMMVFDLMGEEKMSEAIRDMTPEMMENYSRVIVKRFVCLTGMDPDPTMELDREKLIAERNRAQEE